MTPFSDFDAWFAKHLQSSATREKVETLLNDKTAVKFLIAWSLMESNCFGGFIKAENLQDRCREIVNKENFNPSSLAEILHHFHERYQNSEFLSNLMHNCKHPNIESLLKKSTEELENHEVLFLLTSVAYRYRNNIFHGNKGVESWLGYKVQIDLCTQIMQALVTHASFKGKSK